MSFFGIFVVIIAAAATGGGQPEEDLGGNITGPIHLRDCHTQIIKVHPSDEESSS